MICNECYESPVREEMLRATGPVMEMRTCPVCGVRGIWTGKVCVECSDEGCFCRVCFKIRSSETDGEFPDFVFRDRVRSLRRR